MVDDKNGTSAWKSSNCGYPGKFGGSFRFTSVENLILYASAQDITNEARQKEFLTKKNTQNKKIDLFREKWRFHVWEPHKNFPLITICKKLI
jgi:hypothetical protein